MNTWISNRTWYLKDDRMKGWMNGWMKGWMGEWKDEWKEEPSI